MPPTTTTSHPTEPIPHAHMIAPDIYRVQAPEPESPRHYVNIGSTRYHLPNGVTIDPGQCTCEIGLRDCRHKTAAYRARRSSNDGNARLHSGGVRGRTN